MSKGKIVLGTLAGLAIGAMAGILFAPGKGSKTRRKIMGRGNDYIQGLKSKFDGTKKEAKKAAAEANS
jgi:gas vesicle protein